MRFILFALFLLLAACLQQVSQNITDESTESGTANITSGAPVQQIPILGNISAIHEPASLPPASNASIILNAASGANISGNETGNPASQAPSDQTTNQSAPVVSPQIPEGILFGNSSYLLVLDDVSVVPVSDEPCGIFSIRHSADGSVIEKLFICPGDSQYWTSEEGNSYRIYVVKVAAGYTQEEKWAKVLIFQ